MKTFKFINGLSLQVILLCVIGMGGTFFGDYLNSMNWFGDYYVDGWNNTKVLKWGARHYWYNWGLATLTILQLVRMLLWSIEYWNKSV